jgi:hypothetical protein
MPEKFDKLGISFQYPENWTLDEEDIRAGLKSITVYSPGGGFWSVAIHPKSADPARMAKAALEAMRQEYEGIEAEETRQTLVGRELIGYDIDFFYLDLTNSAKIRSFQAEGMTCTVFYQAEDREYDRVQLVFDAMTVSLLQGIAGSN